MSILFASTNGSKSLFAVQVTQAVASGAPVPSFPTDAEPGPVIYVDCELSAKQFETRYADPWGGRFPFADGFARAEIGHDSLLHEAWDEGVRAAIERDGYRRVIVDSITFVSRSRRRPGTPSPSCTRSTV